VDSAKAWLKNNIRYLDPDSHVIIDQRLGKGSSDLVCNYNSVGCNNPCSNDTSFGVGYAPLDTLERLVYETERFVNSDGMRKRMPEIGEDVKVMGLRTGKEIKLTIAAAMISKLIPDMDHYISVKEEAVKALDSFVAKKCELPVEIFLNNADHLEMGSVYLTVTGTSAEMGDDGETGRGNRANGLITPSRPMSLEAAAGKNPVNHTGKIYNVLAANIAAKASKLKGIEEVYVKIVSQIGRAIDDPHMANVQVLLEDGAAFTGSMKQELNELVNSELESIDKVTDLILQRKASLY